MTDSAFALIGPGRLGLRLAARLVAAGWSCRAVRGRGASARSLTARLNRGVIWDTWLEPRRWSLPDLVLVCVGDDQIGHVAESIAGSFDCNGSIVIHTSGLLTASELDSCRRAGAKTASWHPLQSFPAPAHMTVRWDGVPCAVEGDGEAVSLGFAVARQLGMQPWAIEPAIKARYHAAASVAGNLSHILIAAARDLLRDIGLQGTVDPLGPLVETSIGAALASRGFEGLTGAIARHDDAAIQLHLEALPDPLARVYAELAAYVRGRPATVCLD